MAKSPRISAKVGPFTFAYPHLTSPDTEGQYADNKYKVDGVADPASNAVKQAKAAVADAVKQLGVPKTANLPLKKQTEKNDKGVREETGKLLFRAKSQYAPAIVDATGKPISAAKLAKMKIGAGSEGLLEGYFSSYVAGGNPGVSFTLTGVQLIKLVQGGGAGTTTFGAYEGGGFSIDDEDGDDVEDDILGTDSDDEDSADDGGLDI